MSINKILVADDETPIRTYLARKLAKLGYTVYEAEDGRQVLDQAHIKRPDIILLDVKMPELNGIEACKRLKADQNTMHIPVIILSAKAQHEEIQEGLDAGADRYLCKPIGFPDILDEIKRFD